jgi:prepilin-type N-terminal cleavage/methylation domain-containing protein
MSFKKILMLFKKISKKSGFTLVETLVGVAVFLIIATATYQAYVSLFMLINLNQYKILALNLANEQFEIIRNMPYADVGIVSGIPNGKIPHIQTLVRGGVTFTVTTTIRNIDLPFDGAIGSSTKPDLSPADNKLAEVEIGCISCKNFSPVTLTTNIAPKNLETASTNGAMLIKVFDANGVPVSGASVHIVKIDVTPNIVIDDVTNTLGILEIVDAPPGSNAYRISVTKNGYSTDRTYPIVPTTNPKPTKADATVVVQQLTQISFSIDRLSTLSFSSVTPSCTQVGGVDFSLKGSKTIGLNIPKFSQNLYTNSLGSYSSSTVEWDSYTAVGIDSSYDVIGLNPLNTINLDPNSSQNVLLIVEPKNPNSLLVTVKDSATKLPITDAIVTLTSGSYNSTKTTGRGFINQTSWSGGDGQVLYSDTSRYYSDNGNIDTASPVGEIKLKKIFNSYVSDGWLESSTIDTGSPSNFHSLIWTPTDQPVTSGVGSVKMQFATNASSTASTTWTYLGPDGTEGTYYTSSNSSLASIHDGDRYARYKIYLNSQSTTTTPNISDVSFTVTTSCTPPGQVVFTGLSNTTYNMSVSKSGYTSYSNSINVNSSWKEQEVILSP